MILSLSAMAIANSFMLDEATPTAKATVLALIATNHKQKTFFVDNGILPQTLAILKTTDSSPLPGCKLPDQELLKPRRLCTCCECPCCGVHRPSCPHYGQRMQCWYRVRKFCAVWCPCGLRWSSWLFFAYTNKLNRKMPGEHYWWNSSRIPWGNL